MTALLHMTDEDLKALGIPMVNSQTHMQYVIFLLIDFNLSEIIYRIQEASSLDVIGGFEDLFFGFPAKDVLVNHVF